MKLAWPLSQNRLLFKRGNIDSVAVWSGAADDGSVSSAPPPGGGDGGALCWQRAGPSAMAQINQRAMKDMWARRPSLWKSFMADVALRWNIPAGLRDSFPPDDNLTQVY